MAGPPVTINYACGCLSRVWLSGWPVRILPLLCVRGVRHSFVHLTCKEVGVTVKSLLGICTDAFPVTGTVSRPATRRPPQVLLPQPTDPQLGSQPSLTCP